MIEEAKDADGNRLEQQISGGVSHRESAAARRKQWTINVPRRQRYGTNARVRQGTLKLWPLAFIDTHDQTYLTAHLCTGMFQFFQK